VLSTRGQFLQVVTFGLELSNFHGEVVDEESAAQARVLAGRYTIEICRSHAVLGRVSIIRVSIIRVSITRVRIIRVRIICVRIICVRIIRVRIIRVSIVRVSIIRVSIVRVSIVRVSIARVSIVRMSIDRDQQVAGAFFHGSDPLFLIKGLLHISSASCLGVDTWLGHMTWTRGLVRKQQRPWNRSPSISSINREFETQWKCSILVLVQSIGNKVLQRRVSDDCDKRCSFAIMSAFSEIAQI
jgi:hypothetical protein